jgi:hypothetical protein
MGWPRTADEGSRELFVPGVEVRDLRGSAVSLPLVSPHLTSNAPTITVAADGMRRMRGAWALR